MDKKLRIKSFAMLLLCAILICATTSCSTSSKTTKRPISYSKKKTKQARWNSTTSRTTTYYIKKRSLRKRHNP